MMEFQKFGHYKSSIFLAAVALCLEGCGMAAHLRPSKLINPQLHVPVRIDGDANENKPIAVDLVCVDDKDLAKEVSKMTATDWFQKREQIRQDFPRNSAISVSSWEWVPGYVVPYIDVSMKKTPRAVLIFANYSTPGSHRAAIDVTRPATVTLHREDMQVEPLAKAQIN
jgi:type VI secretion system protein